MIIIYDDRICWSYMSRRGRSRGRNLFVVAGGRQFSYLLNKKCIFGVCLKCRSKAVCKKTLTTNQKYDQEKNRHHQRISGVKIKYTHYRII